MGWNETEVGPWCSAQRLGKLVTHPALPFLLRGNFSSVEVPLDAEQCWLRGWDDCRHNEAAFSSSAVILMFLFHCFVKMS